MAYHGVNLGGWLLLEKWMTPSVFEGTDATDEYTFMQTPQAKAKLREHHAKFITEKDFRWMKKHGIGIVRIPVGYWVLDGDAPYSASPGRLDWAFAMCEKYGIKLLLDVHALPGSQNGRHHSGKSGTSRWRNHGGNMRKGLDATVSLARRYAKSPALWGVQVMNEPFPGLFNVSLRRYYNRVYMALAQVLPAGVSIVFSDAFTPRLMSGAISPVKTHAAVMDIHWYHFGGPWLIAGPRLWLFATRWHGALVRSLKRRNGVIIGEWSGCYAQRIFNKYPVSEHSAMVRQSVQAQIKAYKVADAWFYWTYKTEQPGVWNFKSLVDDGVISFGQKTRKNAII